MIVRCVVAFEVWDLPIVRTPKLDSFEYLSWARRLSAGDSSWPAVSPHGPGYPYFLAAILAVSSGSLHAVLLAQAAIGALTAVLVTATARQWCGPRAGLAAGLVYALYGPAVFVETALVAEGLLVFLLAFALWLLCRPPFSRTRTAIAGVALGAATLVRPTAVVIAAACLAWLIVRAVANRRVERPASRTDSADSGAGFAAAGILTAAMLIVIMPAVATNMSHSGHASIQGYGGVNFYIGNSPSHTGRPTFRLGAGWDALNAEASRAGIADPAAQDRYYLGKTMGEIRQQPAAFVALLAKKALWLVQAEEVRDSHSYYFFVDRAPLLRVLPGMGILFPLACVGAVSLARRRASGSLLLLYFTAAAAATVVLLVAGTRYRMPFVLPLAIAAGAAAAALLEAIHLRAVRDLISSAAVGAAAIAISHALGDPRNRNVAEEWAFTGSALITERNLADAEAAYRRALALDPQSGLAWDGLGLALYDGGRLDEAREALTRALAVDPSSARAAFHMALVDERAGRMPEAIAGYRRALESSPDDAEIAYHLGVALGMAGRSEEARSAMRRVVQLTPGNGEAWLDLCLLSLDAADVATAASALQRARELGAAPGRIAFAAQALDRARAGR